MKEKPKVLLHIVLCFYMLLCIIPFILIISASLTDEIALMMNGFKLLPSEFSTIAYTYIFKTPGTILRSYGVSIFITAVTMVGGLVVMSMIGYVLSRPNCKFKGVLSFIVFFTMLFSGGMVPTYIVVTQTLHLRNTLWALILPGLVNAFYVIMIRTFFSQLPEGLFEAAKIDGAGEMKIFFRIAIPLSTPVLATVGFFLALGKWNDWYSSLMYITSEELYPLQYLLYKVQMDIQGILIAMQHGVTGIDVHNIPGNNLMMAMAIVASGPMLAVFPFFQKYYSKGLTVGAIKG